MQSYVDDVNALSRSFAAADARRLPAARAAAYAFKTSALDDTLTPFGQHTVYLACPATLFRIDEGWQSAGPRLAEDLIDQVEARAPGFRAIRGVVGLLLARRGVAVGELGLAGTIVLAGLSLAFAAQWDELVEARSYAIAVGLVGLVNVVVGVVSMARRGD